VGCVTGGGECFVCMYGLRRGPGGVLVLRHSKQQQDIGVVLLVPSPRHSKQQREIGAVVLLGARHGTVC
jgi:hypothetical protein